MFSTSSQVLWSKLVESLSIDIEQQGRQHCISARSKKTLLQQRRHMPHRRRFAIPSSCLPLLPRGVNRVCGRTFLEIGRWQYGRSHWQNCLPWWQNPLLLFKFTFKDSLGKLSSRRTLWYPKIQKFFTFRYANQNWQFLPGLGSGKQNSGIHECQISLH